MWYTKCMKLSVWAKEQGIRYQAAWRMYRDGKLPVPVEQLPTGTIVSVQGGAGAGLSELLPEVEGAGQRTIGRI